MGSAQQMEELATLAEAGRLRPTVAARFPLAAIAEANLHLEAERPYGDIVVEIQSAMQALDKCA